MQELTLFYGGWRPLLHAIGVGGLTYLTLVFLLRLLGKKMVMEASAASLVMSSALGNGLATVVVTPSIEWAQATAGFTALMATQAALFAISSRSEKMLKILRGSPVLIFHEGEFLEAAMRRHGLSRGDVTAAIRRDGISEMDEVGGVVYEVDGKLNTVPRAPDGTYPVLEQVENYPPGGSVSASP